MRNFRRQQEKRATEQANRDLAEIRELIKRSRKLLNFSYNLPKIKVNVNNNVKKFVNKLETNGINFNF